MARDQSKSTSDCTCPHPVPPSGALWSPGNACQSSPLSNPNATRYADWANSDSPIARALRTVIVTGTTLSMKAVAAANHITVFGHDRLLRVFEDHHSRTGYFANLGTATAATATATTVTASGSGSGSGGGMVVRNRPGLITVSNHMSTMDDPVLLSSLVPFRYLRDAAACKWTFCAEEICFQNAALAWYFRLGKVIPIRRGAGLYQSGMMEAREVISRGEWLQLFPEGRCYTDPNGRLIPLRWGVGKLVTDAVLDTLLACKCALPDTIATATAPTETSTLLQLSNINADTAIPICRASGSAASRCSASAGTIAAPVVLPFVHSGMQRIIPLGTMKPRTGQRVNILVGEPIYFNDLIARYAASYHANAGWGDPWPPPREQLYAAITDRIERRLLALSQQVVKIEPTPPSK